ncbi:MAG: DUF3108 domain-containing protein [Lentimicrobium sp.]|jgi:hypothetical protein|nr:DUF3108 domain-containing protein [Lentimicrobium sp.]
MKTKAALTFLIMFALAISGGTQLLGQELRSIDNTAFQTGEKLTFRVYYQSLLTGKVTAGEAKLQIKNKLYSHNDRKAYHVLATGESKGAFNLFFKVNDRFESFIDTEALIPWKFTRRTREGGFKKDDEVNFRQSHGLAVSRRAIKRIPPNTQDIVSVFYYARTLDITGMEPNESFPLAFFLDDSLYVSKIVFLGREVIKTELGSISCLKFKPMVIKGDVFSEPYPMVLWISDDKNRLPILVQSAVVVGSVKMELVDFEGLRNPMHALIKEKQNKQN